MRMTRNALYTALSRAKTAAGLFIVGNLKVPGKLSEKDPVYIELKRLRETYAITWSIPTRSPDICVLNIRSLNKHWKDLVCDPLLNQSSILILQETMTIESDDITIPGYSLITRVVGKQRTAGSGSQIYCKNQDCTVFLSQSRYYSKGKIEYIGIRFPDPKTREPIELLAVYRSPQSKIQEFIIDSESILNTHPKISIIVGDLNVDLLTESNNRQTLLKFMMSHNYNSKLTTSSTDYYSQLDCVFAVPALNLDSLAFE